MFSFLVVLFIITLLTTLDKPRNTECDPASHLKFYIVSSIGLWIGLPDIQPTSAKSPHLLIQYFCKFFIYSIIAISQWLRKHLKINELFYYYFVDGFWESLRRLLPSAFRSFKNHSMVVKGTEEGKRKPIRQWLSLRRKWMLYLKETNKNDLFVHPYISLFKRFVKS